MHYISLTLTIDGDETAVDIVHYAELLRRNSKWKSINTDSESVLELAVKDDNVSLITVGTKIENSREDIIERFTDELIKLKEEILYYDSSGIDYTYPDLKTETETEDLSYPYNPKLIRVESKPFAIDYDVGLIDKRRMDISPDFQRDFVWTDITRKSRLIESIMLRIPLPFFYIAQDEEGQYQVVDGIQRLTVIHQFVNNKFKLRNLEYLKDLDGKWFRNPDEPAEESIPSVYSSRIEETSLYFNVIDPSTPEKVKYDIFKRINTGGKSLNAQEIRNCMANPKTRLLINRMVLLDSFKKATNNSIKKTRMEDKELALRFAGFYLFDNYDMKYNNNMDEFLDEVVYSLNKDYSDVCDEILNAFDKAMENSYILFEKMSFRKTKRINKALYLAWSRHLYRYDSEEFECPNITMIAKDKYYETLTSDSEYDNAISGGINVYKRIDTAYTITGNIIKEIIREVKNDKENRNKKL